MLVITRSAATSANFSRFPLLFAYPMALIPAR